MNGGSMAIAACPLPFPDRRFGVLWMSVRRRSGLK